MDAEVKKKQTKKFVGTSLDGIVIEAEPEKK